MLWSASLLFCSLNPPLCFALSSTIPAPVALLGHRHIKKVFTLWIQDNVLREHGVENSVVSEEKNLYLWIGYT